MNFAPDSLRAAGFLNSDGGGYGQGFTSARIAPGTYQIRLNSVPKSAPIVNVTGTMNDYAGEGPVDNSAAAKTWSVQYAQSSAESVITVRCYDDHGQLTDAAFNFTAFQY